MQKFAILSVILSYSFVRGDIHSTCYEYETYCLFSFGPNVTVNNVNEAQKICEDAKNGSWLLEIVDNRTLNNVDEFLSKYSFPEDTKLIVNAERVGNKWRWINSKSDIDGNVLKDIKYAGNVPFYKAKMTRRIITENNQFAVVCLTGCHSKLETYENKKIPFGWLDKNTTRDRCWEICEMKSCEIWSWRTDGYNYGCWYISPIGNGSISYGSSITVYKLDRSVKTTDKCIGNINSPGSSVNNFSQKKLILVHVIPLTLLLALNITVAVIFWRKLKKRQEITQELHGIKSLEHEYDDIEHKFGETRCKTKDEPYYTHLIVSS